MSNSIADAFKKLNVSPDSSPSEHEKIFNVSYEYLSKVKKFNDLKAAKNCLVALINLDKYYKASQIVKKLNKSLIGSLVLEIGYIYYKIGKIDELIKLYESYNQETSQDGISIGLKHVLAQSYYKAGDYSKALGLYHELIQDNKYDDQLDLIINEKAIVSQLNFQTGGSESSTGQINENNYDLLFNQALIELSTQNTNKSLVLLEKAADLCKSELSGPDLEAEILPIKLTISYVYQITNDHAKSLEILNAVDVEKINDLMIKLITKNNLYSQGDISNVNYVDRTLNYQESIHKLNQKLTVLQYEKILKNSIMLKYASGTLSTSQLNNAFIGDLQQKFPGDVSPLSYKLLLKLDIDYKDLQDTKNLRIIGRKLVKYISSISSTDDEQLKIVAVLLLTYVNSRSGSFDQSLPILESLTEESLQKPKVSPGLVGTLIAVYEKLHATHKLTDLLVKLLEKLLYTPQDIFKDVNYYNFAKNVAFKALNQGKDANATQLFEYLFEVNPKDHLISSILANSDKDLLPLDELTSKKSIEEIVNIDIDTLIPSAKSKPIQSVVKKPSKVTKKKKNPKFGPTKVLKPESELQLDEERWLPMKLRSYYKPTKKDKKKTTGGQQGSTETSTHVSTSSNNKKKKKKGKK
ncbi:SRP72 Signal recognition particle subunit SRP72 [Candida maltosa Xu316]|uniref:Signal recognition particle subunit SRP72 n=1 Tax=Candida maltosa (strain Xu316) TaxID=1245528 RepID=M3IUC5_CANMX|nr:hypothetical protein G210_4770 [Candida maltosa Xu316]